MASCRHAVNVVNVVNVVSPETELPETERPYHIRKRLSSRIARLILLAAA
ncbi:MAG TPA: hypothetical protein VEU97_12125 [Ktedonobacteraceae bacterium]|nr:hypothetical protein [Ktedonobacteraceae bacterium]